jgi:hypothetical protein
LISVDMQSGKYKPIFNFGIFDLANIEKWSLPYQL